MRSLLAWITLALAASAARAGDFAGLTPGRSTLAEAKEVLGRATPKGNALSFSGDRFGASEILVESDGIRGVVQSITLALRDPAPLEDVRKWLRLGEPLLIESQGGGDRRTFPAQLLEVRVREGRVTGMTHLAPSLLAGRLRGEIETRLRRGDRKWARQACQSLASVGAVDPALAFAVSRAALEAGDPDLALEAVDEGLRLSPDDESGRLLKEFVLGALKLAPAGWLGVHLWETSVAKVYPGSPAEEAGIRVGDAIIGVDHRSAVRWRERIEALSHLRPGKSARLQVARGSESLILYATPIDREAYFSSRPPSLDPWEAALAEVAQGRPVDALRRLRAASVATPSERLTYERASVSGMLLVEDGAREWGDFQAHPGAHTPEAWFLRAHAEHLRIEEALADFREGTALYSAHKYKEAVVPYGRLDLESMDLHAYFGVSLMHVHEYGRGAEELLVVHRVWPGEQLSLRALSECLEAFDLARSRAACDLCIRQAGSQKGPLELLENVRARKGRLEGAMAARVLAERSVALGAWRQALADFETAGAFVPGSAEILRGRALVLGRLGRREEAIRILREGMAQSITPLHSELHALIGEFHLEDHFYRDAAKDFQMAYQLDPQEVRHLYSRARAMESGDRKSAGEAFEAYLEKSAGYPAEAERRKDAQARIESLKQ